MALTIAIRSAHDNSGGAYGFHLRDLLTALLRSLG